MGHLPIMEANNQLKQMEAIMSHTYTGSPQA